MIWKNVASILVLTATLLLLLERVPIVTAVGGDSGQQPPPQQQPEVDLGTTLVAIRFQGGVVVAADSRTSMGGYVSNRHAHKIEILPGKSCVVLRSGSAAETQQLTARCRRHFGSQRARDYYFGGNDDNRESSPGVTQVAHWLRRAMMERSSGSGGSSAAGASHFLVAGHNAQEDEARIYNVAPSGALYEESSANFAVAGSGSSFIWGLLQHELATRRTQEHASEGFDEPRASTSSSPPLTQKEAMDLCRKAVSLAMARDGSSGGVVRMCVLDSKNGAKEVNVATEKKETSLQNDPCDLPGFSPTQRYYD